MPMGGGERTAEAAELQERLLPVAARNGDGGRGRNKGKLEKIYLDVLGVCCSAEVALVDRLLKPLNGVRSVSVVVPSRTVIVEHDPAAVSQSQIVKALNKAGLEASVRAYGSSGMVGRWPSPYILASGFLLLPSLFPPLLPPLRWLALAAACAGAPPMLLRALAAATGFSLDINVLMLVAVAGAAALGDFAEAGAIVFLFTTAEWLETLACTKASAGMASLMSMVPPKVVLAATGEVVSVPDVNVGDVVAVRAGEVVPVDGVVVDGQGEVDESSLTGESFPVPKQPGSEVWAGTMNLEGYIAVRTTALAENSTVAKMERLVEAVQKSRSKTQRLIDSCTKYYTPAVVVVAASVVVIPLLLGAPDMERWFRLALVFLVSACPCALVLSTPVATFCALLRAARMGVLVKGGDILESLGEIRVAAFDKTGTITKGEFTIDGFQVVGDKVDMGQLLYWVSSIESKSNHPMAAALIEYSQSKSVVPEPEKVTEFRIYPGEGVYGPINGRHIYIGNRGIMTRSSCHTVPEMSEQRGASVGYVICDGEVVGAFSLSDDCRTGAAEAIRELRSMGIKSVMLTGDSRASATRAQEQLGDVLEELHSELLPEDKVRLITNLKASSGGPTLMVGDGMNDAPALAAADVGLSMGLSGSAAAMETSHATLMSSDVLRVPAAVRLGRRTRRAIVVNVVFSVGIKAAVVVMAVAWRPVLWAAVLADVGTCLLVVLHSMTLLGEPWTWPKRRKGESESCRATARSLALRSQLVEAEQAAALASVQKPREESKNCSCCQNKQSKAPEHSVVIDVPAPPTAVPDKGKTAGCCGGSKSCGVSMVPPHTATRAAPEFRAGEDGTNASVRTASCCNTGRSECGRAQEVVRRGCRDAACCSGGGVGTSVLK